MQLDGETSASAKEKPATASSSAATRNATPGVDGQKVDDAFIPEIDIYITYLVILYLHDSKQSQKVVA